MKGLLIAFGLLALPLMLVIGLMIGAWAGFLHAARLA